MDWYDLTSEEAHVVRKDFKRLQRAWSRHVNRYGCDRRLYCKVLHRSYRFEWFESSKLVTDVRKILK